MAQDLLSLANEINLSGGRISERPYSASRERLYSASSRSPMYNSDDCDCTQDNDCYCVHCNEGDDDD